jgi:hypothetical protein
LKRWLITLAVAILFIAFIWPTPYVDAKGGAGIAIGAFWPMVFYAADEGLPATPLAAGWMLVGLAIGGGIGHRLQRRKGMHAETIASGPVKPQVIDYQPGKYSRVALGDGREIMVSLARTELWIFVLRGRLSRYLLAWVPSLLRKYPQLSAKKTLLAVAPLRKADGSPAPLRSEDGTPLECLREHAEGLEDWSPSSNAPDNRQAAREMIKNAEWCPEFDGLKPTPLSERDLEARLAFRKEIVRLHPEATPQQLSEASTFFGVYNPALASISYREVIQNLSTSDPFCRELEMHLKGPLPSWLCFPRSFWKELEPLPATAREERFKGRARELGIDLRQISDDLQ